VELIQEIGSYAGFAAVLGLAVLSALYFSQSRDVKRLRDWAGRAPERDAEARSRVAVATNMRQTPAAQAQQGQSAAAAATPAAAAASGNSGGASAPAPAKAGVAAGAVGAAGAAGGSGGGPAGRSSVATPARPARVSAQQTSVIKPEDQPRERWYRRIAPRYIALIVAGVLVVGGGITVGVIQLLGNDSGTKTANTSGTAARGQDLEPKKDPAAPIRPGDINVAVLNATTSQGLATQFGDQVQGEGFQKGSVGNYEGPQRAESVVMYAPGKQAEARLVRRKFDISAIEAADASGRRTAPSADVIVVIGADKAGG
jgi:hypothetical protein